MLRAAVAAGTPVGLKAKAVMESGGLVSDDIVVGIIADRIEEPDCEDGFIPTVSRARFAQAEALDAMLAAKRMKLDAVIDLIVDVNEDSSTGSSGARPTPGPPASDPQGRRSGGVQDPSRRLPPRQRRRAAVL